MKSNKQNPLSVIVVFAGLAETAGTTVLALLPAEVQKIFVWYVIGFPILLVILFFLILFIKPMNFYSPDYYKDEKNFMNILNSRGEVRSELRSIVNGLEVTDDVKEKISEQIEERLDIKDRSIEDSIENKINAEKYYDSILKIKINGKIITGTTVKKFYVQIFDFLKKNQISYEEYVPYETGPSRYLISEENIHISGKKFFSPIKVDNDKYFVETHKSKIGARNDIYEFLRLLDAKVELIN